MAGQSPRPATALPRTAPEATEVHVTIGRVEVTAVQEALPVRRPQPARIKQMSLEQYLAKRRGRPA
jgi:hypothetical protein